MIEIAIASLVGAIIADARRSALPSGEVLPGGMRLEPELWHRAVEGADRLSLPERESLAEAWLDHLPPGFCAQPSQIRRASWAPTLAERHFWIPPASDPDAGLWHVTTRLPLVMASGRLLPASRVGRAGLGGGALNEAPDLVSVSVSRSRTELAQALLIMSIEIARGEMTPRRLVQVLHGLVEGASAMPTPGSMDCAVIETMLRTSPEMGVDAHDAIKEMFVDLHPEVAPSLLLDGWWDRSVTPYLHLDDDEGFSLEWLDNLRGFSRDELREYILEFCVDNIEGNYMVPAAEIVSGDLAEAERFYERIFAGQDDRAARDAMYEAVQVFDRHLLSAFDFHHGQVGLTLPLFRLERLDPADVRVVRLAARCVCPVDVIPAEMELRFRAEDLILCPVVYGGF